jgi:hypothetical protein
MDKMINLTRRDLLRLIGIGMTAFAAAKLSAAGGAEPPRATPLLTRRIPASGESLPVIGLGTWQTFDVGPSPAERMPLEAVLRTFVEMGGEMIDSSPMYGNAEEVVGNLARSDCGRGSSSPQKSGPQEKRRGFRRWKSRCGCCAPTRST